MIIVIANRKGGTGKSTTSVNLAAEWAFQGNKTLLIDLDTQGHSTIGLGYTDKKLKVPGIHHIFEKDDFDLSEMIIKTGFDNLSLIAADISFAGNMNERDVLRLDSVIKRCGLDQEYDRIIIDTPPTLDMLLMNAFVCADAVLVPFLPHFLSAVGVRQLAKLQYRMFAQYNFSLRHLAMLPIMFDKRIKIHNRVMDEITQEFGQSRIMRGIRPDIKLVEASEIGQPIRSCFQKSRGAMDYQLLAGELEAMWFMKDVVSMNR